MTAALLDRQPELGKKWASMNPLGRLGRPEELRGVIAWLASDVSPYIGRSASRTCSTQISFAGQHFLHGQRVSNVDVP
jgi:NAD(P)-dependent dehydrogenase (short-subunit alcohol dehydrogenase family)